MPVADAGLDSAGPAVSEVEPEMQKRLQIQYLNTNTNTTVLGTTPNYLDVRKYTMAEGKMFTAGDDRASRSVAVLGAAIPDNLGVPAASLVGQNVPDQQIFPLSRSSAILASKKAAPDSGKPGRSGSDPADDGTIPRLRQRQIAADRIIRASEAEIPNAMAANPEGPSS